MRIAFSSPGDFNYGYDSLVRGEGKYCQAIARVLAKNPNNEVCILGQGNKTYKDEKYNTYYLNIYNPPETEFDIFFSIGDPFFDIGIEPNWMTEHVSKIKTKKRVFMSFFGSDSHKNCNIPVVYPYYYKEVDNKHTFCLPICLNSQNELNKNNYDKNNGVWTTKNSHENPEYLYQSFKHCSEYINNKNGKFIIIDFLCLVDREYKNSDKVKKIISDNKSIYWWQKEWLPYSKMEYIMSKSKFITGIHHPIVGPSQLQIVFNGGVPIIFENQKNLPPYDKVNIPYIRFESYQQDLDEIYSKLDDVHYYTDWLDACKDAIIHNYTDEIFLEEFNKFLGVIF